MKQENRYKTDIEQAVEILASNKIEVNDLISNTINQNEIKNFFVNTCFDRTRKNIPIESFKFRTIVKNK